MKEKAGKVFLYTKWKLERMDNLRDTGPGRAQLAQLRHGLGKAPGELPELWGILFQEIPDELCGKSRASDAEWAIYTALTLYAFHQQGNSASVLGDSITIGHAAAGLVRREDDVDRIRKRLNSIVGAQTSEEMAYQLRGLIQLIRSADSLIRIDYAGLARELYLLHFPERAKNIKLGWGRDFYSVINQKLGKSKEDKEEK